MTDNKLQICFVIPTYNEKQNIQPLLEQLVALDCMPQVLIVDDQSPDGTSKVVTEFATDCSSVHLSSDKKRGLGAAYQRGMAIAINELQADIVVQMDADFSHKPTDAAHLIQLVQNGYDVAIGSRYVAGGGVDVNWPVVRRWLSKGGNRLARHIVGIQTVRDCTSGFRAIRREVLERIDVAGLPTKGYSFQIALLHQLIRNGAQIVEYPIYFADRIHGQTKLRFYDLIEFFWVVWVLRFPNLRTLVKFGLTGLTGVVVNLLSFYVLVEWGVHKYIASPVAIEISIIWNFFLNNYWTFVHLELIGRTTTRAVRFNLLSLVSLVLSFTTFLALSATFTMWPLLVHQAIAIIPAFFFNYFGNLLWTFKSKNRSVY